ncbi:C-type lectin lectoxin-Phi1-like [Homarus americanus]|uniref:C-type lectin-like 39 n=1 Tax=Homarus americanus TaxID=6706 RepID=A0A8J5NBJ8_HOMAM|nr:C-type lectin lectoxin-Phi1-like [Homarus americanus]KAG7177365.1 C-type lectin-like 39 [Homarus americanus]
MVILYVLLLASAVMGAVINTTTTAAPSVTKKATTAASSVTKEATTEGTDATTESNATANESADSIPTAMTGSLVAALTNAINKYLEVTKAVDHVTHCPYPYSIVLDECFYIGRQKMSWIDARTHCQGMKGDLASPNNIYALKAFLIDKLDSAAVFVGATDQEKEGSWSWLDGRNIVENDFSEGEPNNHKGIENCAGLDTEKVRVLNDRDCSDHIQFVCEFQLGG